MIPFDKHRRARKNMSAYADGELPAKEATKLEAHLEACEECRLEVDEFRATIGALRSLPEATPRRSFALTPQVVEAPVPAGISGPSPTLVRGLRLTAAGLAAALVLVFVIDVADSGTSENDEAAPGFFFAGDAIERATDDANLEAADGEDDLSILDSDEERSETAVPAPSDYADAPPDSATVSPQELDGGGSAGVDSGDGSAGSGSGGSAGVAGDDVAEPDSGGEDDSLGGLPATSDRDTILEPYASDDEAETSSGEEPTKAVEDAANESTTGDGDDAADGEAASLNADEDGFDTLLALEIGLGAALAVALVGAIWVTLAARRREVRH